MKDELTTLMHTEFFHDQEEITMEQEVEYKKGSLYLQKTVILMWNPSVHHIQWRGLKMIF